MINNIPSGSEGLEMFLFFDDSAIYLGHRNINTLENKIQISIQKFGLMKMVLRYVLIKQLEFYPLKEIISKTYY